MVKKRLLIFMSCAVGFCSYPYVDGLPTTHTIRCVKSYVHVGSRVDATLCLAPEIRVRLAKSAASAAPIRTK
eukprot:3422913-Karenia_brevis.AAC.1